MAFDPTKNKRLAIFLDGTWNEEGDNTSVWRLRSLCAPVDEKGARQLIFYDTGVGTAFGEKVRGGLYGFGIDEHVTKAYEWLVENYNDGDQIFIFGFSRGAFTARCLAGLVSICGIVRPGTPLGVGQLYARYGKVDRNHDSIRELLRKSEAGELKAPEREQAWLLKYSRRVEIEMLGVWDTVAAIDLPGFAKHDFLDPNLRHDMKNAFHAMALDEHRHRFAPTLWTQSRPKRFGLPKITRPYESVEQRWFVGAHANVGGGYPNDFLPQIPLKWIAEKAKGCGLHLRDEVEIEEGAIKDPVADSYAPFLHGLYKHASAEYFRPVGEAVREGAEYYTQNINETIDASVFEKWRVDETYRPDNLKAWADAHGVKVEDMTGDKRADDPHKPFTHEAAEAS